MNRIIRYYERMSLLQGCPILQMRKVNNNDLVIKAIKVCIADRL